MRILVVQDADWLTKGPHQQHHLIEKLSTRGHEIMVICFDQLWREKEERIVSARVFRRGVHRFYDDARIEYVKPAFIRLPIIDYLSFWLFLSREKETVKRFHPDIVVGFTSLLSCYWGALLSRRLGIPFVFYWTDVIHTLMPFRLLKGVGFLLEQHITALSNSIVAINESLREYIVEMGVDSTRTSVISGGVDFNRFNSDAVNREAVRSKYGIKRGDLVIFFMGWIYEFSGLRQIVSELAANRDDMPEVKLLIVGEGDGYEGLSSLIQRLQIENQTILTGKRPYEEMPGLISSADICILPAEDNETMRYIVPIKMYEYLAMGKPVVASRLRGLLMEFGENNGVIYIDNPQQLLDRVLRLDSVEIRDVSQRAKKFVTAYDWDDIIDRFEKHLLSEIERRCQ